MINRLEGYYNKFKIKLVTACTVTVDKKLMQQPHRSLMY